MDFSFKRTTFLITLFSMSFFTYADNFNVFISGGPTFSKLNNESTVTINNFVTNSYQTQQKTEWDGFFGGGIAYSFEHEPVESTHLSLGIAGYSLNLGQVQGIEFPFINNGIYDTLNYNFQGTSQTVMAESHLAYIDSNWQPFILIGVGSAWNQLHKYNETPTNLASSAASVSPVFSDHTQSSFAYEAGIGVQHLLFDDPTHKLRYIGSLGYRYFNLGKGRLGSFPAQTSSDHLHINDIYTQTIVLSVNLSFY